MERQGCGSQGRGPREDKERERDDGGVCEGGAGAEEGSGAGGRVSEAWEGGSEMLSGWGCVERLVRGRVCRGAEWQLEVGGVEAPADKTRTCEI